MPLVKRRVEAQPRVRESAIEGYLLRSMKAAGCGCFKWASPGVRGVPDRIVILPTGPVLFVELKAPGEKPTELQAFFHQKLRALNQRVFVLDSKDAVNAFTNLILSEIGARRNAE